MKKVLFATTALIATAGMAAADVKLSGYGRFGLDYNEANKTVAGVSDTNITSRLRLQFDMTTEADNGVTFGARFRAQAESRDGVANGATFNGARFFVTAGGFTLGVGNIIGAIENMPGTYLETRSAGIGIDGAGFHSHVGNVGPESNFFNWDAYSSGGTGRNGVEVLYSAGGFNGHISYSRSNDVAAVAANNDPTVGDFTRASPAAVGTERTAIHLAYTFGDWTAAVGYQDSNQAGEDKTLFSIKGDLGQFGVRFAYADNDGIDKYGLYGNVDIGAASNLVAFVTNEDNPGTIYDGTAYGLNYSYDLGGGASFEAGIVENSSDFTTVQAGVYFSF